MTVRPVQTPSRRSLQLRVISGSDRRRPVRALIWALYTLGAIIAFLALIYLRTAVDESAFRINDLDNRIEVENARRHQLHLEKMRLESPQEILPIAEQMLGMVLPEEVVAITSEVPPGFVSTDYQEAPQNRLED